MSTCSYCAFELLINITSRKKDLFTRLKCGLNSSYFDNQIGTKKKERGEMTNV